MQECPLISIIVPVYNVEQYLKRCVDSVLNQTYKNIEVILIDDGSPDACPQICDEYAAADERVRVIHQKNCGVAYARNAGLDLSTGEYIGFVDSDDYVDLTMFEILIKKSMEHDADIVSCNYFLSKGQSVKEALLTNDFILYNPDCFENIVLENKQARISRSLWNKLFRKKLFNEHHIRMCAGYVYAEDFAVSYKLVLYANKVVYTSQPLYYYMMRESSLVTSDFSKDKLVVLNVIDEYERMVKEHFPQLLKKFRVHYVCVTLLMINAILRACDPQLDGTLTELRKRITCFSYMQLISNNISVRERIASILIKLNMSAYKVFYRKLCMYLNG